MPPEQVALEKALWTTDAALLALYERNREAYFDKFTEPAARETGLDLWLLRREVQTFRGQLADSSVRQLSEDEVVLRTIMEFSTFNSGLEQVTVDIRLIPLANGRVLISEVDFVQLSRFQGSSGEIGYALAAAERFLDAVNDRDQATFQAVVSDDLATPDVGTFWDLADQAEAFWARLAPDQPVLLYGDEDTGAGYSLTRAHILAVADLTWADGRQQRLPVELVLYLVDSTWLLDDVRSAPTPGV